MRGDLSHVKYDSASMIRQSYHAEFHAPDPPFGAGTAHSLKLGRLDQQGAMKQ